MTRQLDDLVPDEVSFNIRWTELDNPDDDHTEIEPRYSEHSHPILLREMTGAQVSLFVRKIVGTERGQEKEYLKCIERGSTVAERFGFGAEAYTESLETVAKWALDQTLPEQVPLAVLKRIPWQKVEKLITMQEELNGQEVLTGKVRDQLHLAQTSAAASKIIEQNQTGLAKVTADSNPTGPTLLHGAKLKPKSKPPAGKKRSG